MIDLRDDGTITIDFPDPTGQVTVRPPRYGAFKRLRHERQRIADELTEVAEALPTLPPLPKDDDQSEEAQAERRRLAPIYRERLREIEEMTADTLAKTWRFILIGDDTFKGLADPAPPDDPDEWPTEILVDAAETEVVNGVRVRTNATLLDEVFLHLARVRYRSGPTPTPVP